MPFTPFHMGPGLAIKAAAGRHFSVVAFGLAQVAMDIEPLIGILRGSRVLHGPTHSYLGALGVAVAVALVSPAICRPILRRWNRELDFLRLNWLVEADAVPPRAIVTGAFVGTLSHVLLDSIMHADTSPLAPWSDGNRLHGLVSLSALHGFCVATGLVGCLVWVYQGRRRRRMGSRETQIPSP